MSKTLFLIKIVSTTVLVDVSITETEEVPEIKNSEGSRLPLFATYAFVPSGVMTIPLGPLPTVIVPITVSVEVSITVTILELLIVTYADGPDMAMPEKANRQKTITPANTVLVNLSVISITKTPFCCVKNNKFTPR